MIAAPSKLNDMSRITLEKLAFMVAQGFRDWELRFDKLDQRILELETRMELKFARIEKELAYIRGDMENYRIEIRDIRTRTEYLERKIGLESG